MGAGWGRRRTALEGPGTPAGVGRGHGALGVRGLLLLLPRTPSGGPLPCRGCGETALVVHGSGWAGPAAGGRGRPRLFQDLRLLSQKPLCRGRAWRMRVSTLRL